MLSTCANSTTSPISRFCGITGCLHGSYYDIYIYYNTTRALITKLCILHFVNNILLTAYKARVHCSGMKKNLCHLSKYHPLDSLLPPLIQKCPLFTLESVGESGWRKCRFCSRNSIFGKSNFTHLQRVLITI